MVAAATFPTVTPTTEQRVLAHGVSWKTYVLLREAIDDGSFKMTYFKGALEIITPSDRHEFTKSVLVRMIDLYAFLAR